MQSKIRGGSFLQIDSIGGLWSNLLFIKVLASTLEGDDVDCDLNNAIVITDFVLTCDP